MAKTLTPEQVQAILSSGNFQELIGAVEDEHLDCKAAPYQLDRGDPEKNELSKDVSAFANLSAKLGGPGGHILLGVQTKKSAQHYGDVIVAVSPFPQKLVNPTDYQQILDTWLLARPESIKVTWYSSADDPTKGIVGITVPAQRPELWPFLVRKAVDAETAKIVGNLVGYYERRADGVVADSPEEIQRLMRDGRRADTIIVQRLDIIEKMLREQQTQPAPAHPAAPSMAVQLYRQRRGEAVAAADLNSAPVFALTVAPIETITLPTLFRANEPLVKALRHPPQLRAGGWTVRAGEPEIVKGQLRRAVAPRALILECWQDGTLIFAAEAGDFICWGTGRQPGAPLRINPLALAEATLMFADLARQVFGHASPVPIAVEFGMTMYRMDAGGGLCGLTPGGIKSAAFMMQVDIRRAPEANYELPVRMQECWTPGAVAYALVSRLYTWFGFAEDDIPYVADESGQRVISAELIVTDGSP